MLIYNPNPFLELSKESIPGSSIIKAAPPGIAPFKILKPLGAPLSGVSSNFNFTLAETVALTLDTTIDLIVPEIPPGAISSVEVALPPSIL